MDNTLLLSIKSKWNHSQLEHLIKAYDTSQDMSRSAVFEREVNAAEYVEDWKEIQRLLREVKRNEEIPVFTNMQMKYSEKTAEKLEGIRKKILSDLDLKVLQIQYMVLLLQMNYLVKLKKEKSSINYKNPITTGKDLTMPEMAAILMEMVLKNRDSEEINNIKEIMLEWKKNNK